MSIVAGELADKATFEEDGTSVEQIIDETLALYEQFGHTKQGKAIAYWAWENEHDLCMILCPCVSLTLTGELPLPAIVKSLKAFAKMIIEHYNAAHPNQDGHLN